MFDSSQMKLGTLIKIGKRSFYIVVDDVQQWDSLSAEEKRIQYEKWREPFEKKER